MDKKQEFSKTIDDFLNGNINPYAQIFVCKTTKAMLACGAEDLDVIINQSTLRKIMSNDTAKYQHPHNLDKNIIKSIPNELNDPIMILNGSELSSIVLISNLTDENNRNIIISCKLNSTKSIYEVNEITSIYPKNNLANYINVQLKNHNLIGCNKKRANRLLKSLGLQSSEVEASIDYTNIISNSDRNVNIKNNQQPDDTQLKGKLKMKNTTLQHNVKFLWNGIKIDGQLYKGSYYSGTYTETSKLPEGTISIHMDKSNTPRINELEIENNSDSMTDYFETDTIRIRPDSIYYSAAVKAANDYNIHMEKVAIRQYQKLIAKHTGTQMEKYYKQDLEVHQAKLEKLQKPLQNDSEPASDHNSIQNNFGTSLISESHYLNQEQFDEATKFNQRYDFYNCTFDDIKFTDNVVIGKLENCRFNRSTFENFDAESINFNNSVFTDCSIVNSNFKNCNFENAGLYQSQTSKSDFTNTNFAATSIRRTRFDGNELSGVKFHGAILNGVIITDATINKPVEGLYAENITWDGATQRELEARQLKIFNRLRIEPISSVSVIEQAKGQLEPLPSLEPSAEADIQQQHLDKLQAIAEYEQRLNVSPEERIVEMNYSTAHWQPKNNITPDQAEAVYDYITNNKRIGFDRANEIRQSVGNPPLTPDIYYHNIKNMAFVTRYSFGNENSIDIEAIQSALKEVPTEYVISQMTSEQLELYADYYETAVDYSSGLESGLSKADSELYDNIVSIRKNDAALESKIESVKDVANKSDDKTPEGNRSKLKVLLIKNNESPDEVLSNKDLLQGYSFSSQINNLDELKKALQNINKSNSIFKESLQPSDQENLTEQQIQSEQIANLDIFDFDEIM